MKCIKPFLLQWFPQIHGNVNLHQYFTFLSIIWNPNQGQNCTQGSSIWSYSKHISLNKFNTILLWINGADWLNFSLFKIKTLWCFPKLFLFFIVGRTMTLPQGIPALIPGTCEYVTLHRNLSWQKANRN